MSGSAQARDVAAGGRVASFGATAAGAHGDRGLRRGAATNDGADGGRVGRALEASAAAHDATHPRPSLAEQQAALVSALMHRGPVPAGFDTARVHAAADALAAKRARTVLQVWPALRAMLGVDFRSLFDVYAAAEPLPAQGGPLADGRAFVRFVARRQPLSDVLTLQALAVDQHWRTMHDGLVPRRWPRAGVAWLRESRIVVLAIGSRQLRVPLRLGS